MLIGRVGEFAARERREHPQCQLVLPQMSCYSHTACSGAKWRACAASYKDPGQLETGGGGPSTCMEPVYIRSAQTEPEKKEQDLHELSRTIQEQESLIQSLRA